MREWFKNGTFTPKVVAAAYMTGILSIKKDSFQSAISKFDEFTMVKPRNYGAFVGFTEAEVQRLCSERALDFEAMKQWYDGYRFPNVDSICNPNSVMKALRFKDFDTYWSQTSAAEDLLDYIGRDYNGLTKTVAELIGGVEVRVDPTGFANDLTTFKGKDDVLTLMIHLGYLAYDSVKKTARIPNEEIRLEFQRSIHETRHDATIRRLRQSEALFATTIHKNEAAVAAQIERVHTEETAALHYNREESLRSVIKLAYYTCRDHYLQFEELPAGKGYADVVYVPLPACDWPALVVEVKWNRSEDSAIDQILRKEYPSVLKAINCPILLAGVSNDTDANAGERKHRCKIVEWDPPLM